ncbi:MAG: phage integrase SAM-like domain-containing protein, partial [Pirellulaceae bacterium]
MARTPKPWFWKARKQWCVTIDGQRHMLGPEKKAADTRFHELMADPKERVINPGSVDELFDQFMDWVQNHRAPKTYRWYKDFLEGFLKFHPPLQILEVTPYHVTRWCQSREWGDATTRGAITAVNRSFNWGVRQGIIKSNPIQLTFRTCRLGNSRFSARSF